jgi:hypothetical protein
MASRSKFTPDVEETIIEHVRDGNYLQKPPNQAVSVFAGFCGSCWMLSGVPRASLERF